MTSGIEYVKSWPGLFKIGEFFTLMIAFSSLADFANKSENNGSFKFFLFVTVTAWLITMLLFALFMIIYSAVTAFLLLVSTSLVAEKARQFRRGVETITVQHHKDFEDICEYYDKKGRPCSNVEAAAVFGFIALSLLVADTVFYFFEHRTETGEADQGGFVQQDDTRAPVHQDYKPPEIEEIP